MVLTIDKFEQIWYSMYVMSDPFLFGEKGCYEEYAKIWKKKNAERVFRRERLWKLFILFIKLLCFNVFLYSLMQKQCKSLFKDAENIRKTKEMLIIWN